MIDPPQLCLYSVFEAADAIETMYGACPGVAFSPLTTRPPIGKLGYNFTDEATAKQANKVIAVNAFMFSTKLQILRHFSSFYIFVYLISADLKSL